MTFDDVLLKYKYLETKEFLRPNHGRLLDVGCGDGEFVRMVWKDFRSYELHGLDVDAEKLKIAETFTDATFHHAEFEGWQTDLEFGYITAFNVLEHVADDHEFLSRCNSMLQRKGRLVVSVPNALAFHKRLGELMGITKLYQLTYDDLGKGHRRVYDIGYLRGVVCAAGFRVVGEKGIFFKPMPSDVMMEHYDEKLFDALYEMGKQFPAVCSSIMIVGEKR